MFCGGRQGLHGSAPEMLQEVGERPLEVEGTLSRCRDTVLQKEPQRWGCSRGRTDSPDGPGMDEPKATGLEIASQESAWHTGDKVGKLEQLFSPVSEDQEDRMKSRRLLTGAPGEIGEKPETEIIPWTQCLTRALNHQADSTCQPCAWPLKPMFLFYP